MENASKALIIAGAILISILIIAIGMYIYTSSTGSIENAISSMDTQEIEAFNAMWINYEGVQTGSQVKSMINKLIGHANTYRDEESKVIGINCQADSDTEVDDITYDGEDLASFITDLNDLYTDVQAKHRYNVELDFDGTEIIRVIRVLYNID